MRASAAIDLKNTSSPPQPALLRDIQEGTALGTPTCVTTVQSYRPKEVIFYQGDTCKHLFEVVEGVVKLYKLTPDGRRQVTGFLYPGQFLGLGWKELYSQTAEAVSSAKLCRYPREKLDELLSVYPNLGRRLLNATTNELMVAQDQMLLLGRKTASERLASFLHRLLTRSEAEDGEACEIYLPMIRSDIADYLGLTAETVSRVLGRLRDLGIIGIPDHNNIEVLDRGLLCELAEGEEGLLAA